MAAKKKTTTKKTSTKSKRTTSKRQVQQEVEVMSPSKKVKKIKGYPKKDLDEFKEIILKKRDEIIDQLQSLKDQMMDPTTGQYVNESSPYSLHMAEQGTDAMEREKLYLWAQRENKFLTYLEEALQRIENGTYGYLCYIRISEITEQEGSNVGVGYLYKVFVHFDDNIAYSSSSLGFILTPFLVLSMLISIILFFYIIQKKKNYVKFATMLKRKNTSPVKTAKNKNEVKNVVVRKTKTTSNKNEVKNILARKTQHDNTHRIRYTRGGH